MMKTPYSADNCCLFLLFVYIMFVCCSKSGNIPQNKKESIKKAIQQEMTLHPEATLLDLYKNFFQGRFGPGHMIDNPDAAKKYLLQELQNAAGFDSVLWQAVGYEDRFYRVNLSLVRDGKIDMDPLLSAFIESAGLAEQPSAESWKQEWDSILTIMEQMDLALPDFEQDRFQISQNLEKGILIGHHSAVYREHYHPHYRIVNQANFEKLNVFD